jgi:ribonucleoside-diphosphate reductase alpha chain
MTFADPQATGQASQPFAGQSLGQVSQNPSQTFAAGGVGSAQAVQLSDYKIIRRNGSVVAFEPSKIAIAVTKAFLAVNG